MSVVFRSVFDHWTAFDRVADTGGFLRGIELAATNPAAIASGLKVVRRSSSHTCLAANIACLRSNKTPAIATTALNRSLGIVISIRLFGEA
jgi:hypothetical protein